MARLSPSHMCDSAVNRLVNEYPRIHTSATGESAKHSGLSAAAAAANSAAIARTSAQASPTDRRPDGSSRPAVRGLSAS